MGDTVVGPAEQFRSFLEQDRFMIQRSRSSGRHLFYPRVAEPKSGLEDLEWVEASGLGVIYAATVQRGRPPQPHTSIVLVDLDEGPRMLSRVDEIPPEQVEIGMRVSARIVVEDERPFVTFVPVKAVSG